MAEVKVEEKPRWVEFQSGLTRTSVMAILYTIFIFIPAYIYLTLMTGGTAGIPVAWFTLLLWVELGKLSGRIITKQEATIIYLITTAEMIFPLGLVQLSWYVTSPIATQLDIGGFVPYWAAPPASVGIMQLRTFLNSAWIPPIAVAVVTLIVSFLLNNGLGLFAREAYIETERLYFPIGQMEGTALTVVTGKDERPIRILGLLAIVGFAWGLVVYALPFIMQATTGTYTQLVPIPWIDMNSQVEAWHLYGANLGIFTDISPYTTGLIVGFPVTLGIFIGSFAVWFFGSWIVQTNWAAWGLPDTHNVYGPGFWVPGASIQWNWSRSLLYFWVSIWIGIALAVGIAPIIRHPGRLRDAFSSLLKPKAKRFTEPISPMLPLALIAGGLGGGVILFILLVPNFVMANLWIIPFMIFMPFLTTFVLSRMIGETGVGSFDVGNLTNLLYYGSGYSGVDVWFAPNIAVCQGSGWLYWFKVGELTETKSNSIYKAFWLLLPVALVVGYIYVELFWRLAPIPSGRYPGAQIYWDIWATTTSVWIKGRVTGLFHLDWLFLSFIAGTGIYLALDLLHVPVSFVSIGVGAGTITPAALSIFIGGCIALILRRIFGKEWYDRHKMLMAAGLLIGEGLAVTLSVAMALIINSVWAMPY
jgi:hypothetical protein